MRWSINDLIVLKPGGTRKQAIDNSVEIAVLAEKLGFYRIWYAEHHFNPLLISCAPECIIPIVATKTSKIRVGSGGIILNYYSSFKIAEMFILLSEMFPERIDLGIGRSTSGPLIDKALSITIENNTSDDYEKKVRELLSWLTGKFSKDNIYENSQFPYHVSSPNLFILGSSINSANLSAKLGIPFVFGDFFSPLATIAAINNYSSNFIPNSKQKLSKPYTIICFRIIIGKTEDEVRELLAPLIVMKKEVAEGTFTQIHSPKDAMKILGGVPKFVNEFSFGENSPNIMLGTSKQIVQMVSKKIKNLKIDEIMFQDFIFDHHKRVNAYLLLHNELLNFHH